MRSDDDPEMSYLRSVEDSLAEIREVVHQLTQKEIHLARRWWREGVPLEAVRSGILDVVTKRRAENQDTAVSLSYCRHAVRKHAKLLVEMRTGTQENWIGEEEEIRSRVGTLIGLLKTRSELLSDTKPAVAACLRECIEKLKIIREGHGSDLLFDLENNLLADCFRASSREEQQHILEQANAKALESGAMGAALERSRKVFRDKIIREMYELPVFE